MYSVVITTKNREEYLARALESIVRSSVLPTDVVIVNDGGKKITLEGLPKKEVIFTVIDHPVSKGANYSRNIGVQNTLSEFVFFLDDDDSVTEKSFETRLLKLQRDNNVGLVYTGIQIVSSDNLDIPLRKAFPADISNYHYQLLTNSNVIGSTSRVGIRKNHFYEAGKFDEDLKSLQDYDLWIRLAKVSKVTHDNACGVLYTVHQGGSQVSSKYLSYLSSGEYLLEKYKKDLLACKGVSKFKANIYLRVALSASSSSYRYQLTYALKSFFLRPNLKSFCLIVIPGSILRKYYSYV
ncbi:glycosyltransferase family 2 protein [Vibrio kanaloae]|uniref:glycosyltransferase family 2 protein n=1 Tax=Vibrio kanaloae TaxID=170673 RepID=UPI0009892B18|nr:glycosyltransferase family 2 protein [Vibrio kanaloae]QPK05346.1 glycosyltransferase family 2 protein [Vibrio kanaloae]